MMLAAILCLATVSDAVTILGFAAENCTLLAPGIAQSGFTETHDLTCLAFDLSTDFASEQIYVSVDPQYGDPDLYVATSEYDGEEYIWREIDWGADFMMIEADDSDRCSSCQLIIGIYGVTNTAYEIRAWSASTTLPLVNGMLQTLHLTPDVPVCACIDVEGTHDFHISVTTLTSYFDAVTYVSTQFCPNETHHQFSLDDQGSLWIDADDTVAAEYFISISAVYETWVEVLAVEGSPIQLENAMPVQMEAPADERIHFDLTLERALEMGEVDFVLTVLSGSANLYVGLTGFPDPSTPSSYDFISNEQDSTKEVEIHTSEVDCHLNADSETCQYYVTIECLTQCEFTFMARYGDSVTPLIEGEPVSLEVSDDSWTYFSFNVEGNSHDLIFEADCLSDTAEMYINTQYDYANDSNAELSDSGQFPRIHIESASGNYFVGIHAPQATIFTLSATILSDSLSNARLLLDGESMWVNVADWSWTHRYFKFNVPENTEFVEISIQNFVFNTDLYITNDHQTPTHSHNQWSYTSGSQPLVRIDDPDPGMYYLRVDCPSVCYYSLTPSSESTIHTLTDGFPVEETLEQEDWAYYTFEVQNENTDITIDVSALSGDPDLYVSTNGLPDLDSYTWKNRNFGSDALYISHSDPGACGACSYTIGIFAFSACAFTITAGAEGVTQLVSGTPQVASAYANQMRLFRVTVESSNQELTFTLTDITGNADLYVREGETPSLDEYDYVSASYYSGESIVIDSVHDCGTTLCDYYVGVYGYQESEFTILASSEHTHTTLLDSVPLQMSAMGGEFSFFTYRLVQPQDLIIALTVTSGSPKLFISTSTHSPNIHEHDYMVTPPNALSIAANDTIAGDYYLSVFSETDTTFSLSVISSSSRSGTQLVTGRSEFGQTWNLHMTFFITSTESAAHVSISLQSGEADVYLKEGGPPTDSDYSTFSHTSNSGGWIEVPVSAGMTYIGIKATTETASFWITIVAQDLPVQLSQGVPLVAEISTVSQEMTFLLHSESATQDLNLQTTVFEGSIEMTASPENNPSAHSFVSMPVSGGYALQIPMTELLNYPRWEITTTASVAPARFVILPDCSDVSFLQDGVPQQSQVDSLPAHFQLHARPDSSEFIVTVTALSQCNGAEFYISNVGESDPLHYQYMDVLGNTISVKKNDQDACSDCTYYVSVVSNGFCAFTTIFASEGRVLQLQNGVPQSGSVEAGSYVYYSIVSAADLISGVEISVETDEEVSLYVSTSIRSPTASSNTWSGSDRIWISSSDHDFDPTVKSYHVGVFGQSTATFTILARIQTPSGSEVTTLLYDHLQAEVLTDEDSVVRRNYVYTMPPGTEDMEMQVEVLTGTILSLECNGKELTSNFDGHAVLKCSQENCDACTMEFVILAQPRSIFSLLIGELSSVSSPTTSKSRKILWFVLVGILGTAIFGFLYVVKKNRSLNYELDQTENELNQQGKLSGRQREEREANEENNNGLGLYDYVPANNNNVEEDLRRFDDGTSQLL